MLVSGLKKQEVQDFEQAIMLLSCGEDQRCYKETSVHEHSSRSHTIFKIYLESDSRSDSGSAKTESCLNLVDLAGSERLSEFDVKVETAGEAGFINKSLFVLANVINRLAEGKHGFIPYRDSKLTRILSVALGGNSLTGIICTISPAVMNFHQTLSTLRFATRAKVVENIPKVNEVRRPLTGSAPTKARPPPDFWPSCSDCARTCRPVLKRSPDSHARTLS